MNFNTIIHGLIKMNNDDSAKTLILLRKNSHILKEMLRSHKLKYIIEGLIFMINKKIAIKLYSLMK